MGDSGDLISWAVDASRVDGKAAKRLRDAVSAVSYWLNRLHPSISAAIRDPLCVTLVASTDPEWNMTTGDAGVRVLIPDPCLAGDSSELRFRLLEEVFAGLEAVSSRQQWSDAPRMWTPDGDPDPDENPPITITLQTLDEKEVCVVARLDGTEADELSRFHLLDDFLCDAAANSGVAEVPDVEGGCSRAEWIFKVR